MIALSTSVRIFVFNQHTDMRKSFNGLSGLVNQHFDDQLLTGHLFLFVNRRRDHLKILYFDKDGLAIWYKRLEAGTFQLPRSEQESVEIDRTELAMLLSGIDLNSAQRRKRYQAA